MMNAIRAEWIKLRTITSTWVLLIVSIVLTLFFSTLLAFVSNRDSGGRRGDGPAPTIETMLTGVGLATFLVGVVAVLLASGDFRFTIRPTFAAEPRRLRVLLAKMVVVVVASALSGAVMITLALGTSSFILKRRGISLDFNSGGRSTAVGLLLYMMLFSLAGLAIGNLVRHSAGAIVVLILWPLLVESILGGLSRNWFSWLTRWLPFAAGQRMISFADDTLLFGQWTGGAYFAGFVALLLVLAAVFLRRRDA